jgi:hypothetical protein
MASYRYPSGVTPERAVSWLRVDRFEKYFLKGLDKEEKCGYLKYT